MLNYSIEKYESLQYKKRKEVFNQLQLKNNNK